MAFAEYDKCDGLALGELVAKGEVTAAELMDEAIRRSDAVHGDINALVVTSFDAAKRRANERFSGPFAGVPFALKNLGADCAGLRVTSGSRYFEHYVSASDSELVSRYKRAGFNIMGRTNTPELGILPVTEPELHGSSRNPWDLARTPGGSSGGAAAMVAAGVIPVAHGSDGGGSIRIPSACCGLFGLKPSRARIPVGPGASEILFGMVQEHVISRSVRDSAAALDATCASEPNAMYMLPPPERPYVAEVGAEPGKLRIAFTSKSFLPSTVHPECIYAVEEAAAICESLGHEVVEVEPEVDRLAFASAFLRVYAVGFAQEVAEGEARVGRPGERRDFETQSWLVQMIGRHQRAHEFAVARATLQRIARGVMQQYDPFDVVLTPTLGAPPVRIGQLQPSRAEAVVQELVADLQLEFLLRLPRIVEEMAATTFNFACFTPLANVTGQPSMNVPLVHSPRGLPIGTMFTGKLGQEAMLFRLAGHLERARPWADRRPPVWAE